MKAALVLLTLTLTTPLAAADAGNLDAGEVVYCKAHYAMNFLRWALGYEVGGNECHPPFMTPILPCEPACPWGLPTIALRL